MILYIDYTGYTDPQPGFAYFLTMCILEILFCLVALYVVTVPDLLGLYIVSLIGFIFIHYFYVYLYYFHQ